MTKEEQVHIPATTGKNTLLIAILAASFYLNRKNFADGMILDFILVLALTIMSTYAVMIFRSDR